MKHFTLLITFLIVAKSVFGQGGSIASSKPTVDTPAFFNWPILESWPAPAITNNGQFALYATRNLSASIPDLTIQALNGKDKIVLPEVQEASFTADSRYAVVLQSGDTLCLLTLADNSKAYITGVSGFKLFMRENEEWLAYGAKEPKKKLVLKNMRTGAETIYNDVDSYLLSENAHSLVLQTIPNIDSSHFIRWVNLLTNSDREIWKGKQESNLVLNKDGTQLAFLVADNSTTDKTLWLYRKEEEKARASISIEQSKALDNFVLDEIQGFSADGSQLFVKICPSPSTQKTTSLVPLNVWSYTDTRLQSQQLLELKQSHPSYLAVLNITTNCSSPRRLQFEDETVTAQAGSLLLLTLRKGEQGEQYWNRKAIGTVFLMDTRTGHRTELPISQPTFSPKANYVIGYSSEQIGDGDLYLYETATGTTRNITADMPIPQQDNEFQMLLTQKSRSLEIAGWTANETLLFIYDQYDIWLIDPTGIRPPRNLTNGRKEQWKYRLGEKQIPKDFATRSNSSLILLGFNKTTKQNGFYRLSLGENKGLEPLFVGDYRFQEFRGSGFGYLIKAQDANIYVVKRESATESPNIFTTTDLKSFTQLSKIQPEKSVNWLTAELINFNTLDGIRSQAILYKPENFDSSKKYPMIVQCYEKKSDQLNWYRRPVSSNGGDLDIPWFVSRGYLVLLPDIQYKIGNVGSSALNTVEGAVNVMLKHPYIDQNYIGIQGHSFGGYETNYIATHSNMFAAAVSSSGISNLISDFGNVWPGENSRQEYWEMRGGRIGTTPWENPDLYVKNSPIFNISNVTTPILMVQNRNDKNVHFGEGLQFFTGLRRAGKRCWMLEYDNGGHGVRGDDYKDYLIRMTQFFDHYLTGARAPKWMTRGIPANMKGIDSGLELDFEIVTPGPNLLIGQQERQLDSTLSIENNNKKINN